LNGRLILHGVDAEALCRKALDNSLRRNNQHLDWTRREDALAYLIGVAWEFSERWDPDRGLSFSTAAYRLVTLRLVDHFRADLGRTRWQFGPNAQHTWRGQTRERQRPIVFSLDAGGDDSLVGSLATRSVDLEEHCDPALSRLLGIGSGPLPPREDGLGGQVARRAR